MPASGRNVLGGSTGRGGPSRTSRGRAHAGATRANVPLSTIRVRDQSNAEIYRTALERFAILIPTDLRTHDSTSSCCSIGRPSGSITDAKQPKLTEADSTHLPASRPHLSSLDPQRKIPLQYIRRSSIRKCASRIRLCPERYGPTSSGAYIPDTSAVR